MIYFHEQFDAGYNAGLAAGQDIQAQIVTDLRNEVEALRRSYHHIRAAKTLDEAIAIANAVLLPELVT